MADIALCRIAGCFNPVKIKSKGLCNAHYLRQRRHGDPEGGKPTPAVGGSAKEFAIFVVTQNSSECITWPFARSSSGYGFLTDNGRRVLAHRWICRKAHGDPEYEGMQAAHNCGKGHEGCVNPRHLRWASQSENCQDKVRHGTMPRGTKVKASVLSERQVLEIFSAKGTGVSQREMAVAFGVNKSTIARIWSGDAWSWLTKRGISA